MKKILLASLIGIFMLSGCSQISGLKYRPVYPAPSLKDGVWDTNLGEGHGVAPSGNADATPSTPAPSSDSPSGDTGDDGECTID